MVVGIWNTSLPIGVPMLKRVAALPGQTVCRDGRMITVDGTDLAETLDRDRRGRPLPVWQGYAHRRRRSFPHEPAVQGLPRRPYFGLLTATTIIGRADPLWIHKEQ